MAVWVFELECVWVFARTPGPDSTVPQKHATPIGLIGRPLWPLSLARRI